MHDRERGRLAALGVPLFDVQGVGGPSVGADEYPLLLARLVVSGDARLRAAIPCLLAVHGGEAAVRAVRAARGSITAEDAETMMLLYRIARCLVRSRGPDLRFLLGQQPDLPALEDEPADIPAPAVLEGEMGLAVAHDLARERGIADLAGDATDLFDAWLRIRLLEHEPA